MNKIEYPLVVPDKECHQDPLPSRFRLRLVVQKPLSEQETQALEGVELVDALSESEVKAAEILAETPLRVELRGQEGRIWVDYQILRNIALLHGFRESHEQIRDWVLVSPEGSGPADPEHLVGETVRQMTGVLGGCNVIEIRQGVEEDFSSVWFRLNVGRLMESESDLQGLPDPTVGAGLFGAVRSLMSQ